MLSVWRKAAQFDASRASVSTWIYTIARNLRIDRLRQERGVSAEALYDVLESDEPDQPDDLLEGAERDDADPGGDEGAAERANGGRSNVVFRGQAAWRHRPHPRHPVGNRQIAAAAWQWQSCANALDELS